jgi:molybdopterin molybdotransferase
MSLLPVADAKARVLAGVKPLSVELVPLARADGRVLARDLKATRDQPPFPASAMDGYAVRAADAVKGARLKVIGTAHAGHAFRGAVRSGEAVRIFTGAPLPLGADSIVIQENADAAQDSVVINEPARLNQHIRERALDFKKGEVLLKAGTRLNSHSVGLAAAMNHARLPLHRKPRVAIIATGDELVAPGGRPRTDQIISSNTVALAALCAQTGAEVRDLGIVADTLAATRRAIAKALDADIVVTSGGASVGEHDFVQEALKQSGVKIGFWKIAMRPGKPLMFGRKGKTRAIGLPGNPVSALVCARLFVVPLIEALIGLAPREETIAARLGASLAGNDARQDYLRARLERQDDGTYIATAFAKQDSSMLRTLAQSGGFIVRPPYAPALAPGAPVDVLPIDT